ncbi:hypothetical protein CHS0354_016493 [Potamilus streckersoni]|uniref:Uncharacterized protein n=1 Tax=Potamilus streckersoni TaxID=2493646 RepID=A0AAE0SIX0_9BIVA|nr:hypothetical protein CHS0354_016493 [Potamilus streckersoni]
MDVWIILVCSGLFSLIYGVNCIIVQAHSKVTWSKAEAECQQNNGTLFKPNETSFDVQLFPHEVFYGDSWVAATNIYTTYPLTNVRLYPATTSYRCIAAEINKNCEVHYWHKACTDTYNIICESDFGILKIIQSQLVWKEAKDFCQRQSSRLALSINRFSLLNRRLCQAGFYWTQRVIQVTFQSVTWNNDLNACGVLVNHVLSFEDCSRRIRPLCNIEEKITTRSPTRYYGTSISTFDSVLKTTNTVSKTSFLTTSWTSSKTSGTITRKTFMTAKSVRTNRVLRSTTMKQFTLFEVSSQSNWSFGGVKKENKSSFPSQTDMARDIGTSYLSELKSNSPDIGVIIGSVIGSITFILLMVLLIVMLRKRLSKVNEKSDSTKAAEKTEPTRLTQAPNPMYSVETRNVVLQPAIINEAYESYTSDPEERDRCMMEEIPKPNNSIYSLAGSETNFANYAVVKRKDVHKASNNSTTCSYEVIDQPGYRKETGIENENVNVYDKANLCFRECRNIQSKSVYVNKYTSVYDTTNECGKEIGQSDGMYDKATNGDFEEYDTTYGRRMDTDFTYDHV